MTKRICTAVVLVVLAAYWAVFYTTPMPSIPDDAGNPLTRLLLLGLLLLRPEDHLFPNWFGSPAEFTLVDRLPVLLAVGAILAWAVLLGWLLLRACRLTGPLSLWERVRVRAGRSRSPLSLWERVRVRAGRSPTQPSPPAPLPKGEGRSESPLPKGEGSFSLTRLEIAVFSTGVGLNTLSTWTLLMGLLGLLDRMWLVAVPALLTLAAVWICLWRDRHSPGIACKQAAAREENDRNDILGVRWLWLGLPFVFIILFAGMVPPLDFDVCEYHLQAPKEFLQQGRIAFVPHNFYADMPLGAEMLSLLGMVFAGDWWLGALVGKTVIALFTPLCALAVFAAGKRLYSTGAGVVASLVYISIPWIVGISSGGLIDGVTACYLFLALYALLLSKDAGDWSIFRRNCVVGEKTSAENMDLSPSRPPTTSLALVALSGYLAGGAVATKYPALLFVLVPLAAWSFIGRNGMGARGGGGGRETAIPKSQNPKIPKSPAPRLPSPAPRPPSPVFALAVFLLAAALGCGLWFGKNWVLTGNPTYPLLYNVFGGKTWNADKDRQWNKAHRPQEFSWKLLSEDYSRIFVTTELLSPLIIPLALLAFLPLGRLPNRRNGTVPFSSDENRDSPPGTPFSSDENRDSPLSVPPSAPFSSDENQDGPTPAFGRRLRWGLLAYVIFFFVAWWLLTHRITRFWLPTMPVLALLAGVGASWSREHWWRCLLIVLLLLGLLSNFLLSSGGDTNSWFVPLEQLRANDKWLTPWHRFLNEHATEGGVLLVGDAAVFDLKPPIFYNTCFDDCVFEQLVKGKSTKEILAGFEARHIAYVYVNWAEIKRYRRTYGYTNYVQPAVFDRLVQRGVLEPMQGSPGYPGQIYRVKQHPGK